MMHDTLAYVTVVYTGLYLLHKLTEVLEDSEEEELNA